MQERLVDFPNRERQFVIIVSASTLGLAFKEMPRDRIRCVSDFPHALQPQTYHSRLNVEIDMRIQLSFIKPDIKEVRKKYKTVLLSSLFYLLLLWGKHHEKVLFTLPYNEFTSYF